jgi:UDP-GlcNAc:undecaprenyl-phosphate GlcNAc-1-phosphate transferase
MGFWVAWCAIYASQNSIYQVEAITMLWFVSIPLLDCIGLIFSRLLRGISITSAGRDHIHHKLMRNYSSESSLGIILIISLSTGLVGITLENNFDTWISTLMFIFFASCYYIYAYGFKNLKEKLIN